MFLQLFGDHLCRERLGRGKGARSGARRQSRVWSEMGEDRTRIEDRDRTTKMEEERARNDGGMEKEKDRGR